MTETECLEDRVPISQNELYQAIIDCQIISSNLVLVPYEKILDEDTDWLAPDDEIVKETPTPKTRKEKIKAFFNPPRTQIIRKIGTAKYPPHLYYYSTPYAYKVMPFTHTTAQINEARSRLEVYYEKKAKGNGMLKSLMPIGILMIMGAVAIAIVYIVISNGGGA